VPLISRASTTDRQNFEREVAVGNPLTLMERPLGELRLCAVLNDRTFKDQQIIAALGIGCDGRKTVLDES
jgi:hypothetical protein